MAKIKNLKCTNFTVRLLLSTCTLVGLTGCGNNKIPTIPTTLEQTLQETSDNTLLDEGLSMITNDNANQEEIRQLENNLNKYNCLENINLKEYDTPSSTQELDNLTIEELELLIEKRNSDELSLIEKERINQNLYYIKETSKSFIEKKGVDISIDSLKRAVKLGVCDAVGLEPEYFKNVNINPQSQSDPFRLSITADDPISGSRLFCNVDYDSIYGEMINTIYTLQGLENPSFKDIKKYSDKSLNLIKVSAYSKAKLSKKTITSEFSYKEISEKVKVK